MAGRTILVMDDSATCLRAAEVALQAAGFGVVAVKDASEFVDTLYRRRPDLALVDVSMPGFGGEDVVRFLKEQPGTRCPVFFYSSEEESLLRELVARYQVAGYIPKSADPGVMVDTVKRFFEAPGQRSGAGGQP